MSKTVIGTSINQPFVGYMMNVELSDQNKQKVAVIQEQLVKKFGEGIWSAPPESLHVTLFDWIAPLVEYDEDKEVLYKKIFSEYDKVVSAALKSVDPITVTFDQIQAAPSAIFIFGHDDGQFEQIRKYFLDNIELLPNTKKPPEIVHSTISRFTKELELEPIQEFLKSVDFSITQEITSFRLVREEIDPMLKFKLIKDYQLG
jgi:hypothetical protein